MLKVFCIILILSTSQSLAVLSNAQQDLAIKPIVHKQATNQYLPANIPEISTFNAEKQNQQLLQPQYQSTFIQNSSPYNYNPTSHQYLSSFLKEEVNSTPISYITPSNQNTIHQYQTNSIPSNLQGPLYQYYQNSPKVEVTTTPRSLEPLSHHTSLNQYQPQYDTSSNYHRPSNHHIPTSLQNEVSTTPKSKIPTSSSLYYGPATTQYPQTTTSLPNTSKIPNLGNFNNFSNNHKTHWNPIIETRPQQSSPCNISSNVQPPIELHHGYRYIEPALKVNSSNLQTINGVIYNELGLGQNETNTTQKPQAFVPQNPLTNKTEIETQQGYVYGNTKYNPHYPNTTVLIPVRTTGSYNNYQPIQNHNKFESKNQNLNRQQLEQRENQSPTVSNSQQQSTQNSQYSNRFGFQNLNQQQLEQKEKKSDFTTISEEQSTTSTQTSQDPNNKFESLNQNFNYQQQTSQGQFISSQYPNHKYTTSNYNYQQTRPENMATLSSSRPISHTSQYSQTENNSATVSYNITPNDNKNRRPSSSQPTSNYEQNSQIPQSTRPENMATPTISYSSRPISHTSQYSQTENNITPNDNQNRQPSSQLGVFSNDVNLISHSNNIASPHFQPNRYTTEVTQQIATQIHPNIYTPIKTNANQYYSSSTQQNSAVASQIRPSNYNKQPQPSESSSDNQNYPSNSFATSRIQSNSQQYLQVASQVRPFNYETVNSAPQSTYFSNYNQNHQQFNQNQQITYTKPNLNLQTETNQYSLTNSHHNSQKIPQISPTFSDVTNRQPKLSATSNQIPTESKRLDTSSLLTYPSFNQNLQNTNANRYYSTNSQPSSPATQLTTSSDIRENAQIESNRFETTKTQQFSLPNYSPNQNQQNSLIPNVQTESYHENRIPPSSLSFYNKPNAQVQANQYNTAQQLSTPISPSNLNQHNTPITSHSSKSDIQTEPNQPYSTNPQQANGSSQSLISPESNKFQTSYSQQQQQTVNTIPYHYQSPLTKPSQNPSHVDTESNQFYSTNIQSNRISQSVSSSSIRPNIESELNQYYSSYPQQQSQNTFGKFNQKPSTNFAPNTQTESNNYYYDKPQQSKKTLQIIMTSNTPQQSSIQTDFAQNVHPPKAIQSQSNNLLSTQSEASNTLSSTTNSQPLGNGINFTPQQSSQMGSQTTFSFISSNSNNALSSLAETSRQTPSKQLFSQNIQQDQQPFLAKPSQTHQVPSTNAVSNFFGQTSAVFASPPLSASNNGNIIPPTSKGQPTTNSNYLQMQSQSFEIPYYYNKPSQQNYVETQQQYQKPLAFTQTPGEAKVEPVRLPHLTYGTPIEETSNMYSPPSIIMQPPYFRK